jgi:hypothetical protein
MSDEQRLYRGTRAREVIENEEFQEAFQRIEQDLIEAWRLSPSKPNPESVADRERIHLCLTVLGKVKACLEQTMETGLLAKKELEFKKSLSEKAKAWVGVS